MSIERTREPEHVATCAHLRGIAVLGLAAGAGHASSPMARSDAKLMLFMVGFRVRIKTLGWETVAAFETPPGHALRLLCLFVCLPEA